MKLVTKYGDLIHNDNTIEKSTIWTFEDMGTLLEYKEKIVLTEGQQMLCHLNYEFGLRIVITEYVPFQNYMVLDVNLSEIEEVVE